MDTMSDISESLLQDLQDFLCLRSVSVLELNKMLNDCFIAGDRGLTLEKQDEFGMAQSCFLHSPNNLYNRTGQHRVLPNVKVSLKHFKMKVFQLLQTHFGKIPLLSFPDCYQCIYGMLPIDSQGVPLEHILSSIGGVEIVQSQQYKYLTWQSETTLEKTEDCDKYSNPATATPVSEFTKKILELLKNTPRCIVQISQILSEYARRYGRPLHVSEFGFSNIFNLISSLPHIVQVLKTSEGEVITLSHKVQTRRFTYDLLKILKKQPNKQLPLVLFPEYYSKTLNKLWDPINYGVCEIEDLIESIPLETVQLLNSETGEKILSIPKREQTQEEIERTRSFSKEVIKLLRNSPKCSMDFQNFIPSYHHYFGRQCRVAKFGFDKLIELFESIPYIVTIETDPSDAKKMVVLALSERLKVLGERIANLLNKAHEHHLTIPQVLQQYRYEHNCRLTPSDYHMSNVESLLSKFSQYIGLKQCLNGLVLTTSIDKSMLTLKIRRCFLNNQEVIVNEDFCNLYFQMYNEPCKNIEELAWMLPQVLKVCRCGRNEKSIQLTKLHILANELYQLLAENNSKLPIDSLLPAYKNKFNKILQVRDYGFTKLVDIFVTLRDTVVIESERYIGLNPRLIEAGYANPGSSPRMLENNELSFYQLWSTRDVFPVDKLLMQVFNEPARTQILETSKKLAEVEDEGTTQEQKGLIR